MPFARCIAAGVAPLGQRVRGVFRLPPLSLWTPLSPQRERGCSPLSDPKGVGSNRKYGRFTPFGVKIFSPYFRLPPIGKAPQSLRDSSPQGSGFREMVAARNGPSRENAVQKRPQAFLNCQYKNFISAKYAQSATEGILNRSPHREQVNKKPVRKNSHWLVCSWLTGASGCAGHWCGT